MPVLATDLDRTLFPNGSVPDDGWMPEFTRRMLSGKWTLVYATGRNMAQTMQGIAQYGTPLPDYLCAEVGTRVFKRVGDGYEEYRAYVDELRAKTPGWNVADFRDALAGVSGLRLQELTNQNEFKLSYYIESGAREEEVRSRVEPKLKPLCPSFEVVVSKHEEKGIGYLDILPKHANKQEAIEFLRRREGWSSDEIVYCGDSGNDLHALTGGYRAVLVANASEEVRLQVRTVASVKGTIERIYFAQGNEQHGGNYVAGILEGLDHFRLD